MPISSQTAQAHDDACTNPLGNYLALTSVATPSFAGSLFYNPMGEPMTAGQADMVMHDGMMGDDGMMYAHQRARGQFTCAPEEKRTRLQRKACGATRSGF